MMHFQVLSDSLETLWNLNSPICEFRKLKSSFDISIISNRRKVFEEHTEGTRKILEKCSEGINKPHNLHNPTLDQLIGSTWFLT